LNDKVNDINCDLGEEMNEMSKMLDVRLMDYITSCNIACGYHAGSIETMNATVENAINKKVHIGAHPSFNDRENFGRKSIPFVPELIEKDIYSQVVTLKKICESKGTRLHHVKAHGALYNDMLKNRKLALLFLKVIKSIDPDLIVYTMAHSPVIELCQSLNLQVWSEVFSDREYVDRSTLMSRSKECCVFKSVNQIERRMYDIMDGYLTLSNGEKVKIVADTICIHGDTPNALLFSSAIQRVLNERE